MGNSGSSTSDSESDEKKPTKISTDEGVFNTKQKKEMIETCWLTAKHFGRRVYRRMFQKSSKFEVVLVQIAEANASAIEEGAEEELAITDLAKWEPEATRLEQLLDAVIRNLHNSKVVMVSSQFRFKLAKFPEKYFSFLFGLFQKNHRILYC